MHDPGPAKAYFCSLRVYNTHMCSHTCTGTRVHLTHMILFHTCRNPDVDTSSKSIPSFGLLRRSYFSASLRIVLSLQLLKMLRKVDAILHMVQIEMGICNILMKC